MTDLCSGSGEPAISICNKGQCFSRLQLTDKFHSSLSINDANISYDVNSTDVLEIAFNPETYYTIFNAFHHFPDEEKVNIVQDMQNSD